ncbi:polysaccharide biosynthesis/export family protein [Brevundimonas sp. DC300-4]|uniref:polysaccharide biosynthesis/export family protein n=1 Tax=unclassified Brevundimonas TaxID=2622653 RepID=UPI003CF65B5C
MFDRRQILWTMAAAVAASSVAGCASGSSTSRGVRVQQGDFNDIAFADWSDDEPEYLLYPGDEIEVATPTATELTRTLRVGPDGRIALPLIGQAMAADRTLSELEYELSSAYASQLVRPVVEVTLKTAGPIKVWVDGEVRTPGVYDMNGDIDAYQAIIQAGGFLPSARPQQVALIRRGPGSVRMMRVVDLRQRRGEVIALRRGDVLYVPRSTLGELANFFTQVKAALPVGFNYTINGQYQQF